MSRKSSARNPGSVTSLVKQTRADARQPRSASRGSSLRNVRDSEERAESAAQYEEQIAALKQDIKRRQVGCWRASPGGAWVRARARGRGVQGRAAGGCRAAR